MSNIENRISKIIEIHISAVRTRKQIILMLCIVFFALITLNLLGVIKVKVEDDYDWIGLMTSSIPLIFTLWPIKDIHERRGSIKILQTLNEEYLLIYPPGTPEEKIESKKIEDLVWKAMESMALK